MRPRRWQPTRLPHPRDSPGKNTGAGCHFPLQCMKVKSESEVAQSCPTLSDPMDCSLPGASIHGIFQARVYCHLLKSSKPSIGCCNPPPASHFTNHTCTPHQHTHIHAQHYEHLVNLLGASEKKEKLVTIREDRWPFNCLMAPTLRDSRRKIKVWLGGCGRCSMHCTLHPPMPSHWSRHRTPMQREVQGLGFPGRASQALWL